MDEFAQQLASTLASARPSSNGWLRSACPWCQELLGKRDTKQSFAYNVASGVYRCLRCGSKGCAKDAAVYVGDAQRAKLGKIDAEEAQRTLDLQYYAIHADAKTEVILQSLRSAASMIGFFGSRDEAVAARLDKTAAANKL